MKLGDKIFSRSAWGSREIKEFSNLHLSKPSLGSTDVALELISEFGDQQGWYNLLAFLYSIDAYTSNISPTINARVFWNRIDNIIAESEVIIKEETPNEHNYLLAVVDSMRKDLVGNSLGRSKIRQAFLKHSLNLFTVY